MNITFIGYGNMAKAIARGLVTNKTFSLSASAPSLTAGVNKDGIKTYHDNKEAILNAEIIILAVKPIQMGAVLKEIKPFISPHCLFVSVAAGLSLSWFEQHSPVEQAVIRTMPNTPASVGLAATPMIANKHVTAKQKELAELIFSTIGLTTWANDEEEMDAFTALSGSGPAYVFLFMEAMIASAVNLGIAPETARIFTLQTFTGAINLAHNSDLSLTDLRSKVTSPGGTTEAALNILKEPLKALIHTAMNAAKNRAHELGNAK
ncbi:pyrroline-5-carboxylate reductase [uncultured Legionella sp.]|uniref:pyrroline-5-carboxylate reductase n=1 Tax=uncultured Legionella sp. TaxID=210934 RepID=UPI0026294240|nr:pyrroline-5-carboxylate reductase [uncultured Legionella sp.]